MIVRHLLGAALAIAALTASPSLARADVNAASRAFSDGQAAQLAGDYERAAQSFELAYSIMPSKEALRSAVRAHQQASRLPRAATLAEVLLRDFSSDTASVELAKAVIAEARPKLGRLEITCSAPCTAALDQRALGLGEGVVHVVYVTAGKLEVDVTFADKQTVHRSASVVIGKQLALAFDAPPPVVEAAPRTDDGPVRSARRGRGLPPAVPIALGVVAVGLGGVGIWSGLDTNKAHDAYVENPTHEAFEEGRSKQLRTNLLFAGAGVVGLGAVAVAIFWTNWGGDREEMPPVAVSPTAGGATLSFQGSF
jgi:hypothetical protein